MRNIDRNVASDPDRLRSFFDTLRNDAADGEGITRLAYSNTETRALAIVERGARAAGLETACDAAANLVVTLPGTAPHLPAIACGSHIDSVPQGGNFDGAAGIAAGLAVLSRIARNETRPRRSIKLIALRGEESARFGKPYLGSNAALGKLTPADLQLRAEDDGRMLGDCMREAGADIDTIAQARPVLLPADIAAWFELHIEQGPVLADRGLPIGIVTGIRGNIRHRAIRCIGAAGHSGTVPRALRHDAVFAFADLIARLDSHWGNLLNRGEDLVFTSGIVGTDPKVNAIARIPDLLRFAFEIRSQSAATLTHAYDFLRMECDAVARARGVRFAFDDKIEAAAAEMDPNWVTRLGELAGVLGLPAERLASGAGHDTAVFANAGIPSSMIFIRNRNGSHNPREAMAIDDLIVGIDLMHTAILEAASC